VSPAQGIALPAILPEWGAGGMTDQLWRPTFQSTGNELNTSSIARFSGIKISSLPLFMPVVSRRPNSRRSTHSEGV
jgi:hypothetical protein